MKYTIKIEDALDINFNELTDSQGHDNDILTTVREMLRQKEVGIYEGQETVSIISEILNLSLEIRIPNYSPLEQLRYGFIHNSYTLRESTTRIVLMSSTSLGNKASMAIGSMINKVIELDRQWKEASAHQRFDKMLHKIKNV
jgi:hypothetical protein